MAPKSAIKYAIVAAMLITAIWVMASPSIATAATQQDDSKIHLPKPTNGVPTCGSVLKSDVTLQSDLKCNKDGLIAGASGITINLNGHTIESAKNTGNGILVPNQDHVTINGPGYIKNFENGIAFTGSSQGKVSDLLLQYNDKAVLIEASSAIEISINTINHNNYAVVSDSSNGLKLAFNAMAGNGIGGIRFTNTDESIIAANNMFGNGQNGIFVDSQSAKNKVDYNNVFGQEKADINNANGLSENVNNNDYGRNNNCQKSNPDGIC